jgi:S1-C subfamily serine protease
MLGIDRPLRAGAPTALACIVVAGVLTGCASTSHSKRAGSGDALKPAASGRRPATDRRPASFADLVARVRTGVIRIESSTCSDDAIGTGFLIAPRLIATVDHVVDGATSITLKRGGKVLGRGTVIGEDAERDVALVRASRPLTGYRFAFAQQVPRLGDGIAALGFPLGLPLSVSRGSVSGTGRKIPIDGAVRRGLVQTDAAVNPGNSGGPLLLSASGKVVGLVDLGSAEANGIAFAVNASVAAPLFRAWQAAPQPVETSRCADSTTSGDLASAPPDDGSESGGGASGAHSATVTSYEGTEFSIAYPAAWNVRNAETPKSWGTDTTIVAPGDDTTLLRVDVTDDPPGESAMDQARPVIDALRSQPGYRELDLSSDVITGQDAVHWEFLVREKGQLLHKEDEVFTDDTGRGVAILTQAPAGTYSAVASDFAALRDSYASG